jgi:hypothetical protein
VVFRQFSVNLKLEKVIAIENSTMPCMTVDWWRMMAEKKALTDDDDREELEKKTELFEKATREMLDKHAKKIELCARSKRWWSEEIAQKRRDLGRVKRKWRQRKATRDEVKEAKSIWQRAIREAKRKCWEDFLDSSVGMKVWMAVRYTKVEKGTVVPTLVGVDGMVADTMEAKSKMLAEMAFPPPVEYNGGSGEEREQGGAFGYVEEETVSKAIFAMSGKRRRARMVLEHRSYACYGNGTPPG